ncbi:hypothetical protein [Halorientalis halophila]|uniref:hypothetical protein n=1 Tax=Halorientalis halophila TaxID=3108499 RepID=UPI0030087102
MSRSERRAGNRVRTALSRTRAASALVFRRGDSLAVFTVVTAIYLVTYLWAIGHLAPGLGGFDLLVVSDPLGKLLRPELGPFSFTPVARVALGPVTYLFSLNTLVGLGLAALVGLNLALTYLVWRQPAACGIGRSSTGLLASVPALLSGTACCGPVVLLVVGVQASGVLLTGFQLLLPLAVALLLGSLVLVGRRVTVRD